MTKPSSRGEQIIAGLDIGTTKVSLVIALANENGIDVVGVGKAVNIGVRQGAVVNIDATTEAIRQAREEAELMSGFRISHVWVGVSGSHIRSFDSKGMVAITEKEVRYKDIDRVIEAAKAVAVSADREVLHVLPREFKLDDQEGITEPVGMSGVRLEASVHIVTGSISVLQNTKKCVEKSDLKMSGLVLQPLASAMAVLSEDEKKLGVSVVDLGGGLTDMVSFVQSSLSFTSSIPVGGMHFTHDVAVGLRTPQLQAEELKRKYGCALTTLVDGDETIEVSGVGGRKPRTVLRKHLGEILEPRAEETLELIDRQLKSSGFMEQMGSGIVLTGGASQLDGLIEMGEFVFDVPVRLGVPRQVGGLTDVVHNPSYASAVGLLTFGWQENRTVKPSAESVSEVSQTITGVVRRIREFIGGAF